MYLSIEQFLGTTFYLFWFSNSGLFARALEGIDVKQLITNVGSGVGAAPAAAAAPAAGDSGAAKEEKKEEKKEESDMSDDDMGFGKLSSLI